VKHGKKTPGCMEWRGNFLVVCETVGLSSMDLVTACDVGSSFSFTRGDV